MHNSIAFHEIQYTIPCRIDAKETGYGAIPYGMI